MARVIEHPRRTYVRDDRDVDTYDGDYPADYVGPQAIVARIVWFVAGVLLALLGVRFVLMLLGANPASGFANFIYTTSHPFVAPFFNLFHYNVVQYGVSRFEVYTLVAMVVYGLIAWGITYLLTINRRYV